MVVLQSAQVPFPCTMGLWGLPVLSCSTLFFEVQLDFKKNLDVTSSVAHAICGRELYSDSSTNMSIHPFFPLVNPSLS